MRRLLRASLLLTAAAMLMLLPRRGEATLLQFLEMEELAEISDLIVVAEVQAVESGWNESHNNIRTRVTLGVQKVLRGSLEGTELRIELPGGYVPEEDLRQVVPGVPKFTVGEEAVVFLRNDPNLFCPVAGWIQGKFSVITEPETGRKVVLDRFEKCRRYLARKGVAGKPKALGAVDKVAMEDFAAVIAEIQKRKGSGK